MTRTNKKDTQPSRIAESDLGGAIKNEAKARLVSDLGQLKKYLADPYMSAIGAVELPNEGRDRTSY
jgi:hypothetical protein